ncbi:MAG: hypothetical protein OXC62_10035 [Aestuariivita sp.]|nr:hypothetical protein [Aestuariivita sp.]
MTTLPPETVLTKLKALKDINRTAEQHLAEVVRAAFIDELDLSENCADWYRETPREAEHPLRDILFWPERSRLRTAFEALDD